MSEYARLSKFAYAYALGDNMSIEYKGSKMSSINLLNEEISREEKVPCLIFGVAKITTSFVDIDGYSKAKTIKELLSNLAKAVEKYNKYEADSLRDSAKFNEIVQYPARKEEGPAQYILEWEEVSYASRINDQGNLEQKNANYYIHIRIVK